MTHDLLLLDAMPTAYSYLRFSTPQQAEGDSARRQKDLAANYIADNPELELILDTDLKMSDLGISGFKGANTRETAALGAFKRRVEDGLIEPGSYLLVESFDRLSRTDPWDVVYLLQALVRDGVTVVTLQDDKVYSREKTRGTEGGFALMMSIMVMIRAHEESETKSRRMRASWEARYKAIAQGKRLARRPFWIDEDGKEIPERADVVREVFRKFITGIGTHRIALSLNDRQIPTPTSGQAKSSRVWRTSTVQKLVYAKNVIGTLVTKDGGEHHGYYPAVVDEVTWLMAQARRANQGRTRTKTETHPFGGLFTCARCGGTIIRAAKTSRARKDGTRKHYAYLVCSMAKVGAKEPGGRLRCEYKALKYSRALAAVRDALPEIVDRAPSIDNLEDIRTLDGEINELVPDLEEAFRDYRRTNSKLAREHLRDLEHRHTALEERRKALVAAAGPIGQKVMQRLMAKPRMANDWLRQVFSGGVLDLFVDKMTLRFQGGGQIRIDLKDHERTMDPSLAL